MGLSNYTELQATIDLWLGDRGDLSNAIPILIRLAEADFSRRAELVDEKRDILALATSPAPLPSDCREVLSLYYNDATARGPLEITSPETVALRAAEHAPTGRPMWAAVVNNGQELVLAPEPDQSYTVRIRYARKLTPLASASGGTNWLLNEHPDVYLYGSLLQSAPFLRDDERIAVWSAGLERALAQVDALTKRRESSANTPHIRPRRPIG